MQFCGTAVLKYCSTAVLHSIKLNALSNIMISPRTLWYSVEILKISYLVRVLTNFLMSTEFLNALGALSKLRNSPLSY